MRNPTRVFGVIVVTLVVSLSYMAPFTMHLHDQGFAFELTDQGKSEKEHQEKSMEELDDELRVRGMHDFSYDDEGNLSHLHPTALNNLHHAEIQTPPPKA